MTVMFSYICFNLYMLVSLSRDMFIIFMYLVNVCKDDVLYIMYKSGIKFLFCNYYICIFFRMNDSSDDTMTHSYGNETFEDSATATASKKTSKSQTTSKSPLEKLKKYRGLSSPGRSPRGLFSSRSHSRNSESESEDSFSLNGKWTILPILSLLRIFYQSQVLVKIFRKCCKNLICNLGKN